METIGIVKSTLLEVAEISLVYKSRVKAADRHCISKPKDAYDLLVHTWDLDKIELVEQFKVLLLNRTSKVLGLIELSSGGVAGTVADIRHIFAAAIKANASSIIVAHNHPSGSLQPSHPDKTLTAKIKEAGLILDIQLHDHLIITSTSYLSFAEEGLL